MASPSSPPSVSSILHQETQIASVVIEEIVSLASIPKCCMENDHDCTIKDGHITFINKKGVTYYCCRHEFLFDHLRGLECGDEDYLDKPVCLKIGAAGNICEETMICPWCEDCGHDCDNCGVRNDDIGIFCENCLETKVQEARHDEVDEVKDRDSLVKKRKGKNR